MALPFGGGQTRPASEQATVSFFNDPKEDRCTAVSQASQPTIKVQTATAFAAGAGLSGPDLAHIQIEKISRAEVERPSGRRFGALVHAVLAVVDLNASADKIGAVAQANARLMDATAVEVDAAITTIRSTLQHPLMQRAAKAQALRRETPVQHCREDGVLIEGVVDLAFQESTPEFNGWTVVDFKTDREVEKAEDRYRAQVATYVEAVAVSTAAPARGFLLIV
jgi:ATP-dependent exoDNAse (exonuclease V) beta subunit